MQPEDLGTPPPEMAVILSGYPTGLFTLELHRGAELADRYALAHGRALLESLGIAAELEEPASAAEIAARRGFASRFMPALEGLLERAAAAGELIREPAGRYRRSGPLAGPPLAEWREVAAAIDPRHLATLDLLDAAAAVYPGAAEGSLDAEAAMFAPANVALWARYFDNDNSIYAVNNRLAAFAAAARLPAAGPLRVLEVGAGFGSGSLALTDELADRGWLGRVESYLLTEPSPFFRRRAERALRGLRPELPLTAAGLDIDGDWGAQGAAPGSFDLVYAVNVLHVAKRLDASLAAAWRALRPGGWLVLGECLRPLPDQPLWPEFIFALLDSFNSVQLDPAARPRAGFLTPQQWRSAVTAAGFVELSIEPDVELVRAHHERFLTGAISARRPPRVPL